ncbi:hypothetical protein BU16DRAFT_545188 [Lophium mytilinum]|uniref:Uncharacterized protein n=1 Tax=Lophium mytilinum TaxID=390894 RepID=A0A6A6QAU5_9PEZI|nr:hypothetical protein BU16DRAFT_545188 [Lophium mytilinum]
MAVLHHYLRRLPASHDFKKQTYVDFISQQVKDRDNWGYDRDLLSNEIAALALNDISAMRGYGFFFHVKVTDKDMAISTNGGFSLSEALMPALRKLPNPKLNLPNLLYIYLIALLPGNVSLYGIQYIHSKVQLVFKTTSEQLVIIATPLTLYAMETTALREAIGWNKKKPKKDREQLRTTKGLFKGNHPEGLARYARIDIDALYNMIVSTCAYMPASYSAEKFCAGLPRCMSPELGIKLRIPLSTGTIFKFTNASSRCGLRVLGRGGSKGQNSRAGSQKASSSNEDVDLTE